MRAMLVQCCGKIRRDREEEVLHQFLIGVDDSKYAVMRTNLLSQQPPIDLNWAYQALLQEEESCGIAKGRAEKEAVNDAHAFAVSDVRSKSTLDCRDKSKLFCWHCKKTGQSSRVALSSKAFLIGGLEKAPPAAVRANAVSGLASSIVVASRSGDNISLGDLKPEDVQCAPQPPVADGSGRRQPAEVPAPVAGGASLGSNAAAGSSLEHGLKATSSEDKPSLDLERGHREQRPPG
uniref:Uncharacterized protein n=1 Tax=Chenopodium quinoa TaxID=63459 RepID=A0A803N5D9_CHEQI